MGSQLNAPILKEECPKCGSLLSETLQQIEKEDLNYTQSQNSTLVPKFQTAYEEYNNNLFAFDIYKIDSFLNLKPGENLCIIGEPKYTQLLLARLCVTTLMMQSRKRKKREAENSCCTEQRLIFVDAGNNLDIYQYVNFARQYGLDIKKFLQSIVVSRMFTIYQLANTIIYELPRVIIQQHQQQQQQLKQKQQFVEPRLTVVSDLLDMFVNDPQIKVEEAKYLLKEIMNSIISRTRRETLGNPLIVMSLSSYCQESMPVYNKILLPRFDKRIEISNSASKVNSLDAQILNNSQSKACINDNNRLFLLEEKDLLTVSAI